MRAASRYTSGVPPPEAWRQERPTAGPQPLPFPFPHLPRPCPIWRFRHARFCQFGRTARLRQAPDRTEQDKTGKTGQDRMGQARSGRPSQARPPRKDVRSDVFLTCRQLYFRLVALQTGLRLEAWSPPGDRQGTLRSAGDRRNRTGRDRTGGDNQVWRGKGKAELRSACPRSEERLLTGRRRRLPEGRLALPRPASAAWTASRAACRKARRQRQASCRRSLPALARTPGRRLATLRRRLRLRSAGRGSLRGKHVCRPDASGRWRAC